MKILHVMAGGKHGGAETAFVDMCIAMHEAGQDIEVITRPNEMRISRLQEAGIKVHTLPFGSRIDIYTRWQVARIIKHFKPQIIQAWMSRACQHIPAWHKTMRVPRYAVVGRLGSPYKLKYFKQVDYFVALTPDLSAYLIHNQITPERIKQIPNFAEVETVQQPLSRSEFETPEDATLILGLGRLHSDKAFDTLIEVAAQIPNVYVWIAGEGPQRAMLEAQIATLGISDRVKLLGWRTDRAALLQTADICAFISRNEGFGTVFIQSWAQKTPVVACESDGPRQFIHHQQDGLISAIDDIEAIKANIELLMSDKALYQRLVENGYQRYQASFTKPVVVQQYLDFYKDMLTN